jgi:hypothetical protein
MGMKDVFGVAVGVGVIDEVATKVWFNKIAVPVVCGTTAVNSILSAFCVVQENKKRPRKDR